MTSKTTELDSCTVASPVSSLDAQHCPRLVARIASRHGAVVGAEVRSHRASPAARPTVGKC